ncbi:hypothetical protein BPA01_54720 [Brevibacillus parabrevis]|uniref:Terminase small subunit n=1 Tax=Brevibacillus parabrevis TaxID=54914 RepID=A0A4Y3PMX1_BREPA|nr:hypothetical protein BPA01_54720 [Brevibacillus parabrevis]
MVGPYEGSAPRKVFLKQALIFRRKFPILPPTERCEPPLEIDDEDVALTEKQRLFLEYLRDFNATRDAIAVGYRKKTGWENLRKPQIQAEIKRQKEAMADDLGLDVQRIIAEYMKIAFADITDLLEIGQKEVPVMTMFGPMTKVEGNPVTKIVN